MNDSDKNLLLAIGAIGIAAIIGVTMTEPVGIRNNNPGNIRRTNINWQGKDKNWTGEYEKFITPFYGIRALARNLLTYYNRGVDTVAGIISRWAPTNENPTQAYVEFVSRKLGVHADETLYMPRHIVSLVKAIIEFENGKQPYDDDLIIRAVKSAGWKDESIVGKLG